jgi:hypothetical protein
MATGRKSEAKRQAVAFALASGKTAKQAAAEHHVGERTVGLWMAEDDFRATVRRFQAELFAAAIGILLKGHQLAALKIVTLVNSPDDSLALRAARCALEVCCQLRQTMEFDERLAALEATEKARTER